MAKKGGRGWVLFVVIIIVLAGAAGGGLVIYSLNKSLSPTGPKTVQFGDNVTVNYIGILGSGPQAGKVFDTSILSVARDNASYPKALSFSMRPAANYTPLPVHVGPSGSYTIGNLTFITTVPGFWQGLIGLPGNQTSTITVPPSEGYAVNPACQFPQPITMTLPVTSSLSLQQFGIRYPGITAATGATFPDPQFKWSVLVFSSNATTIVVQNQTSAGQVTAPFGFPALVTNVTSTANGTGAITVQNQLTPASSGLVQGYDNATSNPCTTQTMGKFIVTSVDPSTNTYIADHNEQVAGETLIFEVEVIDIFS
jgi:FKBP-type peptidyl-prolyl cis-trans isomerase 2